MPATLMDVLLRENFAKRALGVLCFGFGLCVLFLMVVWGLVQLFIVYFGPPKIEVNSQGAFNLKAGKADAWVFLLSANGVSNRAGLTSNETPWTNTQIHVDANQKIVITVSGLVNVSVRHSLDDAANYKLPQPGWVGPGGAADLDRLRPVDLARMDACVEPGANYGQVLVWISASNSMKWPNKAANDVVYRYPDDPKAKLTIGGTHPAGWLNFAVNDGWLDPKVNPGAERCFVVPLDDQERQYYADTGLRVLSGAVRMPDCCSDHEADADTRFVCSELRRAVEQIPVAGRQKPGSVAAGLDQKLAARIGHLWKQLKWKDVVQQRYWQLWYDDNSGAFQVTVELD